MTSMNQQKAMDRVKKLLKLSRSDNEHEAAHAAAKAAALIEQFQLSEALLRVDDSTAKAEPIVESATIEGEQDDPVWKRSHKRVAWKGTIAYGVALSLGAEMWWDTNGQIRCYGRESAVQAWSYTCRYLFTEVDRLCEAAWAREGAAAERAGQSARAWKNAFRVGAANTICRRLRETVKARQEERKQEVAAAVAQAAADDQVSKEVVALALVDKDADELKSEYAAYGKANKFRTTPSIGQVSSRSGLDAGREAGASIALNQNRGGLPEGTRRIGKEG